MAERTVTLRAYAKVNLTLEVVRRRADGYHDICTLMQTISLADELTIQRTTAPRQVRLSLSGCASNEVPGDAANLAFRAAALLLNEKPERPGNAGLDISLSKAIPQAAGLGGGSADGAAVLRAATSPLDLQLTAARRARLALQLGSDVPFFLRGGTQLAEGRGERLQGLPDLPRRWLVLVSPPLILPQKTQHLYSLLRPQHWTGGVATRGAAAAIRAGHAGELSPFNVFDAVAADAFPALAPFRIALTLCCGAAYLCGAGPSLFAPMPDKASAEQAAGGLRSRGVPAVAVHTVSSEEASAVRFVTAP